MTRTILATVAIVALLAPRVSFADDAAPTPQEIKEARRHFQSGKTLITQKRFADAIAELEAAYQLDPRTEHLYNLGVAHQLNGDDAVAIQYYRLFLDDNPTGRAARDAAKYLADLEAQAAAERARQRKQRADALASRAAQAPAVDPAVEEAARREIDRADQHVRELEAQIAEVTKEESDTRAHSKKEDRRRDDAYAMSRRWERSARTASSGTGGGRRISGVVLLALGAGALSYSMEDLLNADDRVGSHGDAEIVVPAGGILLLAGLGLYVSGELAVHSHREASAFGDLRVTPSVGPTSVGVVLSTRF